MFPNVLAEDLGKDGRDGDRADVVVGAVLEASFVMGVAV